jgi:hypothetical protein
MAVDVIVVPVVVSAVVLAIIMPAVIVRSSLCLVIYSGGRSLHCHASSCIVVQTAVLAAMLAVVATIVTVFDRLSQSGALLPSISSHHAALIVLRNLRTSARYVIRASRNRKLEDGHLVEGGNVGIRGSGADSPWIPGLQTVEVYRFVKVRRDRGILPLERVQCNECYCTSR